MRVEAVLAVGLCLGFGTLALRLVFAELRGRCGVPDSVRGALGWVPVAALAALVAPILAAPSSAVDAGSGLAGRLADPMLLASAVTGIVAWRTRNLLLSVGAGMVVFWLA